MPMDLAGRAKSNLTREDATVSRFNDVANRVSRMPYKALNGASATPDQASPVSSFTLPLGGPVDTSIGAPVSSFKEPTISGTTNTANSGDSSNWRFRSFGPSQLPNVNGNSAEPATTNGAYNQQVSPVVTPFNPSGAGTAVVSSPVVPPNYQPKDMSAQQKLYGWGSGNQGE